MNKVIKILISIILALVAIYGLFMLYYIFTTVLPQIG